MYVFHRHRVIAVAVFPESVWLDDARMVQVGEDAPFLQESLNVDILLVQVRIEPLGDNESVERRVPTKP